MCIFGHKWTLVKERSDVWLFNRGSNAEYKGIALIQLQKCVRCRKERATLSTGDSVEEYDVAWVKDYFRRREPGRNETVVE